MSRSACRIKWNAAILLLGYSVLLGAADGTWLRKVPDADRARTNPYAGNAEASAAGRILYADNCAKCHGEDGLGRRNRPSLRGERVRSSTDGELAWILRNGSAWKGMPAWSSLPEPERWQIISYLRSLPAQAAAAPASPR